MSQNLKPLLLSQAHPLIWPGYCSSTPPPHPPPHCPLRPKTPQFGIQITHLLPLTMLQFISVSKTPPNSPNQLQYPITQKHQQGLKPIVTKLLCQGLLCPTHSPYNTPILPVKKPNGSYCLVQDLRLINAAVSPTHPIVPNPYSLLSLSFPLPLLTSLF